MNIRFIIAIPLVVLGACGGGGGTTDGGTGGGGGTTNGGTDGGGATDPFANAVTLQPGDALPEDRAFITKTTVVTSVFNGSGSIGAFSPQTGTVLTGASSEDKIPDIRFDTAGNVVEFAGGAINAYRFLDGNIGIVEDADGTSLIVDLITETEYSGFAGWTQSTGPGRLPGPGTPVVFGVLGAPITTLPTGTATYTGTSVGMENDFGELWLTSSDIAVNTDFSNVTVASTNTIVEQIGAGADGTVYSEDRLDFTASGVVGSGAYTATGDGMTVNGAFFGPNAEETGGTFHGTSSYGSDYGGAFVAGR